MVCCKTYFWDLYTDLITFQLVSFMRYNSLGLRERNMVYFNMVMFYDEAMGDELVFDLHPSFNRTRPQKYFGCLSKTSVWWMLKKQRWAVSRELLALQGLALGNYTANSISEADLVTMAGNAFNYPCVIAYRLATLTKMPASPPCVPC
jgi:hypothetical protein